MARKNNQSQSIPIVNRQWVLGIVEMPVMINPLQGEFVLLIVLEGEMIVGAMPIPAKAGGGLRNSFEEICRRPAFGAPRRPSSLLIDIRLPNFIIPMEMLGIPSQPGTSHELTAFVKGFAEQAKQEEIDDGDFDYEEYPEPDMRRFFTNAADWADLALWEDFSNHEVMKIHSKYHRLSGWLGSIMGIAGESYGILFFKNITTFRQFCSFGRDTSAGKISIKDPMFVLNLEEVEYVPEAWRKAQMANGWPVVQADLFPIPEIYGRNLERGIAPAETMNMISDILEAFSLFWQRNAKGILSGKTEIATGEFKIGKVDIKIEFPIPVKI